MIYLTHGYYLHDNQPFLSVFVCARYLGLFQLCLLCIGRYILPCERYGPVVIHFAYLIN